MQILEKEAAIGYSNHRNVFFGGGPLYFYWNYFLGSGRSKFCRECK